MFKHPGEVVLSTCAPGFIDSSTKTKASEIIDTHGSHMPVCVCASAKLHAVSCCTCHVYTLCVHISNKWGVPKMEVPQVTMGFNTKMV